MITKAFTVKIRRNIGKKVKPEAELVDGKTFVFLFGWLMGENDPYPDEEAWRAYDTSYPIEAPSRIASGDLIESKVELT